MGSNGWRWNHQQVHQQLLVLLLVLQSQLHQGLNPLRWIK